MYHYGITVLVLLWTTHPITAQTSCIDGDLRLESTTTLSSFNSGRLEICRSQTWGSIQALSSTSFWSEKNVLVACRHLGYNGGLNSVPANQVLLDDQLDETSPVHYSSISCDGTEASIENCAKNLASPLATHNTDVYIVCLPRTVDTYTDLHSILQESDSIGDVRLVGSTVNGQGAVEILATLGWSSICPDSNWTTSDAIAICQNLGYESGRVQNYVLDSSRIGPRNVHDAVCISASSIVQTSFSRITAGSCTFLEVSAASDCQSENSVFAGVTCSSSSLSDGSSRFVIKRELSVNRFQGVVEILYDRRWGVLCRVSTSGLEEDNICRGFGYDRGDGKLLTISQESLQSVESRLKPLWIPNFNCISSATRLSLCFLDSPLGYGTCGSSGQIFALDCGSSGKQGLYSYEIAAIAIGVIIALSGIAFFIYAIDKNRYKTWQQKNWYKILCDPKRWCDPCKGYYTRNRNRVTVVSFPRGGNQNTPRANVLREVNSDPDPEPEPQPQEEVLHGSELTKPPPPAYTDALNFSSPDTNVEPCAPPPAYSVGGNPAYPPAGSAYPPAGSAYPPVGNPYPPVGGGNPAYPSGPPPGGYPAYPVPVDSVAYPPPTEIGLPYPT